MTQMKCFRSEWLTSLAIWCLLACGSDHGTSRGKVDPGATANPETTTSTQNSGDSVPTPTPSPIPSSSPDAPTPPATSSLCAAPAPSAAEQVIFDDSLHLGWDVGSYGGPTTKIVSSGELCSGSSALALENVSQKYTGMVLFNHSSPVSATHVSMRLYVDAPGQFTLGINFVGQVANAHDFLLPPNSTAFVRDFQRGWQRVEGDIPDRFDGVATGPLTGIILEIWSDGAIPNFRVDDVRITPR